MEILRSREETINVKLLWLILGIFLIPALNSFEGLVGGVLELIGLPILSKLFLSVGFNSLILISLLVALFWIIRDRSPDMSVRSLTLNGFRILGVIFLATIIAGRIVNFLVLKNQSHQVDLMDDDQKYAYLHDSAKWYAVQAFLSTLGEIVLFIIYFVLLIRTDSQSPPTKHST
jgi:hypothetical protein